MKTATIQSVCECQGKLGAVLDEQKHVIRGFAKDRRTGKELVAPAHSIGANAAKFQVGWQCPLCTRNQLRSFDESALAFVEQAPPRTSSMPPPRTSSRPGV